MEVRINERVGKRQGRNYTHEEFMEAAGTAAALEPGTYNGFTGYINYRGIEGYAENAGFILLDEYEKYMHGLVRMIWTDGTWLGGRCSLVQWKGGVWKNGTFENGNWHAGTWENGVFNLSSFHDGTWNNGTFVWSMWHGGTWLDGTFVNSHWNGGRWKAGTWENSTVDGDQLKMLHVTCLTAEEWELVRVKNGWCI